MKEIKRTYFGVTYRYKETEISGKVDNYRRPLTIKVAKQSDAQKVVDEETGIINWINPYLDIMPINAYIKDEEYNDLTEEKLIELAKKLKL